MTAIEEPAELGHAFLKQRTKIAADIAMKISNDRRII